AERPPAHSFWAWSCPSPPGPAATGVPGPGLPGPRRRSRQSSDPVPWTKNARPTLRTPSCHPPTGCAASGRPRWGLWWENSPDTWLPPGSIAKSSLETGPAQPGGGVGVGLQKFAQLAQGLGLELPDPFPRQAQPLANLVERVRFFLVEAEAQFQHDGFPPI